jgi:hypothetical protein
VYVGLQKIAQRIVHHALPLDPAAAAEGIGHDQEAKVALSLRSSASVAGMARRIVDQLEPLRLQSGQARLDFVRNPHEGMLSIRRAQDRAKSARPEPPAARNHRDALK